METYPVDLDPEQIVRWVIAEKRAAHSGLRVSAWRTAEARDIPNRAEFHLGDEEREDLREVATIATLEIAPLHASEGWLLTVAVEDETGPPPGDGDETIDVGTFYSQFIRRGRGTATVIAEVSDAAAKTRLTRLLHTIEVNRHGRAGKSGAA